MNLVWGRNGGITRERPGEPSAAIAALAGGPEVEMVGRLSSEEEPGNVRPVASTTLGSGDTLV